MSEKTKREAQTTEYHLSESEGQLYHAEESAKRTGDKQLVEKVVKVREGVREIRKELVKKLDRG